MSRVNKRERSGATKGDNDTKNTASAKIQNAVGDSKRRVGMIVLDDDNEDECSATEEVKEGSATKKSKVEHGGRNIVDLTEEDEEEDMVNNKKHCISKSAGAKMGVSSKTTSTSSKASSISSSAATLKTSAAVSSTAAAVWKATARTSAPRGRCKGLNGWSITKSEGWLLVDGSHAEALTDDLQESIRLQKRMSVDQIAELNKEVVAGVQYVNKLVHKTFSRKSAVFGTVVAFLPSVLNDNEGQLWHVVFNDSDEEDWDLNEVQ